MLERINCYFIVFISNSLILSLISQVMESPHVQPELLRCVVTCCVGDAVDENNTFSTFSPTRTMFDLCYIGLELVVVSNFFLYHIIEKYFACEIG